MFNRRGGVLKQWADVWSTAEQINVIIVDWSAWSFCNYLSIVKKYVEEVAHYVADNIDHIYNQFSISHDNFIFGGHSWANITSN